MANTFIDVKTIAASTLPLLASNTSMIPTVWRNFDSEFGSAKQKGDSIQVEKPQRFSTIDGSGDISSSFQDITDETVDVTLAFQRSVAIKVKSADLTLSVPDFTRKYTEGAVVALSEYINAALLGLAVDIPYFYGTAGTIPDTLADIAKSRKILQDNLAPTEDRYFIMDTDAEAAFISLDALADVSKAGTNQALRDAALGRVHNVTLAADQQVLTHTAGAFTALTDLTSDGVQAIGATTFNVESAAGASTASVVAGDIFTIETGSAAGQYVCTAAATAVSGDIALVIYPALRGATADTDTVAFADEATGAHVDNLMFQKKAFALAMAPLAAPIGGATGAVMSAKGMSVRVVMDYDVNNDNNILRYDILFGVKTLYPELACRVIGGT